MEDYILNCDFSSVTDDTNNEFRESLDSFQEELSSLDYAGILKILKTFQNKVCVRGFPAVNSPGYELADSILTTILQAQSEKAEENKFSSREGDESLLDLYVDLLKSGPGSGHCELLLTISKHMTFQDLNGDRLQKVINGFKAIFYVEEKDVSTYIDTVEQVYPDQLSTFVIRAENKDRLTSAEVHQALMELFVFYLIQLPHVPDTLQIILRQAQEKINEAYDEEPFSGLQDANFYRLQLQRVHDFINDPEFPQTRDICETTPVKLQNIFRIRDGKMINELYADICQLLKVVSLKNLTGQDKDLLKILDSFYKEIPDECFKNPKMFETWAATALQILEKSPHEEITGNELANTAERFTDNLKPKAELGKIWLSIFNGFCGWVNEKGMQAAERTVSTNGWKSCWKWKENVCNAKSMIVALTQADYISAENVKEYSSSAASFLETLVDQLRLVNMLKNVEVELAELAIVTMEAFGKGIAVCELCETASKKLSLKVNVKILFSSYEANIHKALMLNYLMSCTLKH